MFDCLDLFFNVSGEITVILVHEWHATSFKGGRSCEALPDPILLSVALRYDEGFCENYMSQKFAKAVWALFEAGGGTLEMIHSVAEKRAFVQVADIERVGKSPDRTGDARGNWYFEGIMTLKEAATYSVRCKLLEVQPVCEKGGKTVLSTIVGVIGPALDGITRCKNAKLANCNMDISKELEEVHAAGCATCEKLEDADWQIMTMNTQLPVVGAVLEESSIDASQFSKPLRSLIHVVEKLLNNDKARVKCLW